MLPVTICCITLIQEVRILFEACEMAGKASVNKTGNTKLFNIKTEEVMSSFQISVHITLKYFNKHLTKILRMANN